MKHEPYSTRRNALLAEIAQFGPGVAIIPTAPERVRNRDSHHPYRYDSYFWYLSGFPEPEAVIVLVGGNEPQSILFCREKNEEREVWDGFRYGPETARDAFGFDEAYPFAEFTEKLPELIANRSVLWHTFGHDTAWDDSIVAALNAVRGQSRAGNRAPA
ncbi:MAG: aminopeptidase P N-terminal domain-containing protein, partial [Propionivibrio sp.]